MGPKRQGKTRAEAIAGAVTCPVRVVLGRNGKQQKAQSCDQLRQKLGCLVVGSLYGYRTVAEHVFRGQPAFQRLAESPQARYRCLHRQRYAAEPQSLSFR